jgi:hypothetical protein
MGDWLVIIGAACLLTGAALMFGDLMELRAAHDDPEAVEHLLQSGVAGSRWIRLGVQVLVTAGLALITIGVVVGV